MAKRTDLAIECCEMLTEEIAGIETDERIEDKVKVTHIRITTEEGAKRIGKPVGNYVTIEIESLGHEDDSVLERGARAVAAELRKMIKRDKCSSVFVVGLGNQYITPDSIGPNVVSKLLVTRHIQNIENLMHDYKSVSAIAPGVMGMTGIETGEIISGIKERVMPDLIIAVDALASRKLSRLGATVQLADTGINPGSGVGNNRKEISEKTMGVPVIAIGIPMVVDVSTVADDVIDSLNDYMRVHSEGALPEILQQLSDEERLLFIKEVLCDKDENMIVTPNDVDVLVKQASFIIAEGINQALHD
ncbi:MAG: GPR endopeptidase [Clostridia bacterium]|nr:GPR endopeptidase [Clostridia bacterium]